MTVLGLMAIPYLDFNPQGSGYYTIRQRRFATAVFLFGFLMLWVLPIFIGIFLRGPNWSSFGVYQPQDPHQLPAAIQHEPVGMVLDELCWAAPCRRCPPGRWAACGAIPWRELAGRSRWRPIFSCCRRFWAARCCANFRRRMGRGRYWLMVLLLLLLICCLPLKMVLGWSLI